MRWLAKISVFWLFVAFALAQKNTSDVVSVTYSYPKLTVSIAQPANLAVVLGKLCQETQSDCDGIELAVLIIMERIDKITGVI